MTIRDVGDVAVMLSSDGMSRVTGDVTYVDGGLHVRA
jgi:enoyl-[acyl-carrier protein] reductase I